MSETLEELEQRVLQLHVRDKARLVLHLLQSMEPADSGDIEQAWQVDAESRLAAVKNGRATTVSADEVFAKLDRRLP